MALFVNQEEGEMMIPLLHDLIIDVTVITTKDMMMVMLMSKVMMISRW